MNDFETSFQMCIQMPEWCKTNSTRKAQGSDAVLGEKRCLLTKWIPRSHRKIPQCTPVVCTRAHWGWCCEQQAFCMYRSSIWLWVVSRHTYTYWPNVISSSSGNVRVFMITFLLSSRYNKYSPLPSTHLNIHKLFMQCRLHSFIQKTCHQFGHHYY